jgi:putative NIF3 family GTP cyclohydrolase 1 type 2
MEAKRLIESLNKEFELDKLQEGEWSTFDLGDYATESFRKNWMGLVLDNSEEIHKVYTAVFPSAKALDHLISLDVTDALLFTHHPMVWTPEIEGVPFENMPAKYLDQLKKRRISYYAIHVPLDRNGPYSTTASLARALEIETEREFFEYFGSMVGIIGKTECKTIIELSEKLKVLVGHPLKTWSYGNPKISNQRVALVAGGGNDPDVAQEVADSDVNTYITGITKKNPTWEPGLIFHEICKKNRINVIAATHYSTEKFACIAVQKFFDSLGVPSEFIEDEPNFLDYG